MTDIQIINIFYNQIIPEAKEGKINCCMILNIAFNLIVNNTEISTCEKLPYESIIIPTLKVTDKELFDSLLVKYVRKALEFYNPNDFNFLNDIFEIANNDSLKKAYQVKYIIASLFANASFNDFANPLSFLNSRINMFDHNILDNDSEMELGYIESIGASIHVAEEICSVKNETPYRIRSYLRFDDGYKLALPLIYIGNTGFNYQLYAIQKGDSNSLDSEKEYLKKIRGGVTSKIKGAPEHYFLAAMMALAFSKDTSLEIIPFLVERWNAKRIAIYQRMKINPNLPFQDMLNNQETIQNNITNTFIRYFIKITEVSSGINFITIPTMDSSNLNIQIEPTFISNSLVFNEIFNLITNSKIQNPNFRK